MREEHLYPREMFDISANGIFCGVFVPTHVMKKFMKISAKWSAEIQQLLNEYEDELFVSNWAGYFPKDENGRITDSQIVKYTDTNECSTAPFTTFTTAERIKLFKPAQPEHVDMYICDHDTAVEIAKEIYEENAVDE